MRTGECVSSDDARRGGAARFPDTSWGLVQAAATRDSSARDAFATLCARYWLPIYAVLRRQGHGASDAEDLTQGFFLHLIDGGAVARADPERGRFRSFLHGALVRFLASDREREVAQKRGGDRLFVPFDAAIVETQWSDDDASTSLQLHFDRRWARALVGNVLARLADEHAACGEDEVFAALQPTLQGANAPAYAELAARLGRNEGAIKTAVHRLRRRFRDLLRAEVAATVASDAEIDDELAYLRDVLASESEKTVP
jgi:DNA-directed RNA polymerase specialized sigma24 family protein